ncbi:hypothetical protein BY996DRAFT_6411758 [Phakopsora pachyrhizi]|uniref:Expressed protein n=1 Tax=Phakopsora pachyrhizi TaxID=170000 RepID=A0AAV0AG96_PHAPC|nr:hypothetical protein BY996DRAFT_6412784 [Phakopsora pachyrhizi]KAI8457300.1 hypothetical protein BY996DRAFT_6411758 [Phakopsora pachyrhizi]CAH7666483.1 expressed protein [Phakopsora pachyrhizi]
MSKVLSYSKVPFQQQKPRPLRLSAHNLCIHGRLNPVVSHCTVAAYVYSQARQSYDPIAEAQIMEENERIEDSDYEFQTPDLTDSEVERTRAMKLLGVRDRGNVKFSIASESDEENGQSESEGIDAREQIEKSQQGFYRSKRFTFPQIEVYSRSSSSSPLKPRVQNFLNQKNPQGNQISCSGNRIEGKNLAHKSPSKLNVQLEENKRRSKSNRKNTPEPNVIDREQTLRNRRERRNNKNYKALNNSSEGSDTEVKRCNKSYKKVTISSRKNVGLSSIRTCIENLPRSGTPKSVTRKTRITVDPHQTYGIFNRQVSSGGHRIKPIRGARGRDLRFNDLSCLDIVRKGESSQKKSSKKRQRSRSSSKSSNSSLIIKPNTDCNKSLLKDRSNQSLSSKESASDTLDQFFRVSKNSYKQSSDSSPQKPIITSVYAKSKKDTPNSRSKQSSMNHSEIVLEKGSGGSSLLHSANSLYLKSLRDSKNKINSINSIYGENRDVQDNGSETTELEPTAIDHTIQKLYRAFDKHDLWSNALTEGGESSRRVIKKLNSLNDFKGCHNQIHESSRGNGPRFEYNHPVQINYNSSNLSRLSSNYYLEPSSSISDQNLKADQDGCRSSDNQELRSQVENETDYSNLFDSESLLRVDRSDEFETCNASSNNNGNYYGCSEGEKESLMISKSSSRLAKDKGEEGESLAYLNRYSDSLPSSPLTLNNRYDDDGSDRYSGICDSDESIIQQLSALDNVIFACENLPQSI